MESILDDIDAMIGELDDLNFNPNKKTELSKKDLDVIDIKDGSEQGFTDLINELAAFNPAPVSKEKTLRKERTESLTDHQLVRGGSLRSKSEDKEHSMPRKGSVDTMTLDRKRSLTRQGSGLETFTLLPSPAENIKIHMSSGNLIKTVRVERAQTAWDVCLTLVLKSELELSGSWCLVEQLISNSCERTLEDHESVIKVYKSWGSGSHNNRLCLVENNKKWEFLEHPEMFFSSGLLDRIRGRSRDDVEEVLTEEYFGDKAPPVEGYLYFKDAKHSWTRKYFILRSSGLYYSTKGKSRAPQDLACFTTLRDVSIYMCVDARVDHKSPTDFTVSFKPTSGSVHLKDMKCVAAESEQDMLRWYHALRVVKYGDKIPENRASVLLEVTQEIERLNTEARKQAREAELLAARQPVPTALSPMSPKPARPGSNRPKPVPSPGSDRPKPVPSPGSDRPKPVPSPKPDLKKMLPVPPAKPKMDPPPVKPRVDPPPVKPRMDIPLAKTKVEPLPTKPKIDPQRNISPNQPNHKISPKPTTKPPSPQHTKQAPAKQPSNAFAEAQALLARSQNGSIKRTISPTKPLKPAPYQPLSPPTSPSSQSPPCLAPYQPGSPPLLTPPDSKPVSPSLDDLPPPPLEFLVDQPILPSSQTTLSSSQLSSSPEHKETPSKSKISAMVKNITAKTDVDDKPAKQISLTDQRSSSVSELSSKLNLTLRKTGPGTQPAPPKPLNKPSYSTQSLNKPSYSTQSLSRSQTCPQMTPHPMAAIVQPPGHPMVPPPAAAMVPPTAAAMVPPTAAAAVHPTGPPGASSVQKRAQELAGLMAGKPLQSCTPLQKPDSPPPPPPVKFQNLTNPGRQPGNPPRHPLHQQPGNPPPQHLGQPAKRPQMQPMRAPPPTHPPVANYVPPQLPSRKDSLVASKQRSRTTSGSSAGSHHSLMRPGSASSHDYSSNIETDMRAPPRVQSNMRGSFENLAMSTASTVNTSSGRGIPNIFQRNSSPFLAQGRPPNNPPPCHPLHFPPQQRIPMSPQRGPRSPLPFAQGPQPFAQSPQRQSPQSAFHFSDQMPQQMSQQMPQQMSQQMPQQMSQQMPQQMSQQMPQQMSQQMPQQMSQQMPQQNMSQQMSQQMSVSQRERMMSPSATSWQESLMRDTHTGYQEQECPIPRGAPLSSALSQHSIPVNINNIRQVRHPTPQRYPDNRQHSFNKSASMGYLSTSCQSTSNGSNTSEEVVYEYIEDGPNKAEHLQHWLANMGQYDDDALSVTSDHLISGSNGMLTTPVTPPPRTDSKRSIVDGHLAQPWFHGPVSRDVANTLLASHGLSDGLFLVRSSSSSSGDYVLSMTHAGQVKHFQITQRGGRPPWYAIEDGPAFPDICKLVEHYSSSPDRLPAKLSCYCMKT